MSRAERRAYKRMMKNQDPYALPSGAGRGGRSQRTRARRAARPSDGSFRFVSGRFLTWLVGGAVAIGLLAFSVAWPNGMPFALYVGMAGAAVWALLVLGFRLLQGRALGQR